MEVGTFAEALEGANNNVILAMNAISSMISKMHSMILDMPEGKVKDVKHSEVVKVLERYGEVKIYQGDGCSVHAAIMQAIMHCPFFDADLKDFNGLVLLTLTCSCNIDDNDLPQSIHSFRRITGFTGDILLSKLCEPNLEQKLVITLLVMGRNEKMVTQSKGFFSSLLQNLPSFFHFFQLNSTEVGCTPSNCYLGDTYLLSDSGNTSDLDLTKLACSLDVIPDEDEFPDMMENGLLRKESYHETIRGEVEPVETNHLSDNKCIGQNSGEELASVMMMDIKGHMGPAFHIAQLWVQKCSQSRTKINEKVDMFSLPAGVKSFILSPDCTSYSNHLLAKNSDYINQEISDGIAVDMSKKNSLLYVRAAMMLETEREFSKCWNPIVEIQYKGGIYRGICQGGLPDGKGRLTSMDGSFYEGFWKCGKKSGLGTFCYSNGDLFRGLWRDDLMHGKGWLYFHTGDRWFANFWRGKANGEGRFFSKNGSVFFGNFRDGWRHGQSVSIDADGSRWTELWDDGVLVDRNQLD